ncbi:alpha/beta hydrolase [Bradyrhizobium sp. LjRoot220]|uniref:alpha/beta hydrolase n=1 Tax=Bradyrhizobium sp. LjRoot220 TaxID=3342284 RepID=UPI003ECE90D1
MATNDGSLDPRLNWATLSQAERDAAYDNNSAVKNSAALIAERNQASEALRASRNSFLDIPYGDRERTKIDLYPAADRTAPCLVFLHGGYWQRNSRDVFAMLVEGVAAHGWSVAIPGYSLAPDASLTRIVAEVPQSLDWLAQNGAAYGISGPLILSGWSAGAQLVAMVLDHPHVAAGLAISGVYDLAPIRDTGLNNALKLTDREVAALSPLRLPAVHKRLDIAYGTAELPTLVFDSIRLHEARMAAGAPGRLVPIEGADHFSILGELRRPDGALVDLARKLVDQVSGDLIAPASIQT